VIVQMCRSWTSTTPSAAAIRLPTSPASILHALAVGVRAQRRKQLDRDNPWRKGGLRSAAVSFRRERGTR
jgi:hypothetical protein